jgi:hypothetical protein
MTESEGNVTRAEILPLMGVVKRAENGWMMASCPGPMHKNGDRHPSLGLSGAGVLKCFTGCSFADVMKALRERAGDRGSGPRREQQERPRDPGTMVTAYEYRDPVSGELLAVKGRFERPNPDGGKPDKTFRWRLPEGTYEQGLGGKKMVEMPLWGADEVLKAPPEQRIWVAEGESATSAIRARNEIAVCGPWGASQRDFGTAFEVLRGREVVLWPDNDVAGRDYMAEVRRHLRGIAKSVALVAAPVPPKGDAVEYFQGGGTVDALLASVVTKPTVDVLGMDHFRVRVPTDSGPVAFDFAGMSKNGGEMAAELTVTHLNPVFEGEPYSQRINILSQSARSQLETALGKQFGKDGMNWTTVVSTAYSRIRTAFMEQDRGLQIGTIGDIEALAFHVDTLFPDWQPTIVFGDGSSNKTYITYAIAAHIAMGLSDFCGFAIRRQTGVLIVDYETGAESARFRFKRIFGGMGNDPLIVDELLTMVPVHYWPANGVPLQDQVEALARYIERHDIGFMIVDSGADACGGEPEKASVALAYFNALSRLRVTSVTICHVTNTESDISPQRPFGSRFWHNRARRTWYVKRDKEEESDDLDVGLLCRKVNDGRWPSPLSFKVHFDGESGPVTFSLGSFRDVAAFENETPVKERVLAFLTQQDGPMTIAEISKELGLAATGVKTALNRNDGKCFTRVTAGTGRGTQTKWGALAHGA